MAEDFVDIFKQPDAPADRGKYLARVFGIFSEELVRIWAADPRAPYKNLGRPTLRMAEGSSGFRQFKKSSTHFLAMPA